MENQWGGGRKYYFVIFFVLWVSFNCQWVRVGGTKSLTWSQLKSHLCSWIFRSLVRLNLGAWGKYLATHASLATTRLLIICGSPIHPVDAFIPLLPVLLKEIRMFGQSKVLSFCFWCWSRECGGGVNPRFCNATTGVESYSQDLPHARWRTFVGVCRRLNQKCLIFILLGLDWSSG